MDREDSTIKITPRHTRKCGSYLDETKYDLIVFLPLMTLCGFTGTTCAFRYHSTLLTIPNLSCSYSLGSCTLLLYMLMLCVFKSTFSFEMTLRSQISNLDFRHSLLLKYLYEVIYVPPVTTDVMEHFDLVQNYGTCFGLTC